MVPRGHVQECEAKKKKATLTAMSHAGQGNPQGVASTRLFRNPENPDSDAGTPPSPVFSRLLVDIHRQTLTGKSGFKFAPKDQRYPTPGASSRPLATLTAASTGKYSSRAQQSKHRNQLEATPEGGPVTSGPPKTPDATVSKHQPSSSVAPPPVDFSGIRRAELVPLEANRFPTTEEQGPRKSETPSTSSPEVDVLEEPNTSRTSEQNLTGRVTFVQTWRLCIVATATLVMPLIMLILSYLATPEPDLSSVSPDPTMASTPGTSTKAAPSFTLPARLSPLPTADPWAGVPVSCRRGPQIGDDVRSVSPLTPPGLKRMQRHNFFCLYNNTKFFRGANVDFLPQNLPLALCKYVVYWSFGIDNGVPFSRTPQFDQEYGLSKLRYTVNNSGAPAVKIVLAVGGYSSDHPQFSLMGRDNGALSRFVRGTMELVKSHILDGVVIHWREPVPGCQSQADEDASALNAVFLSLRRIFKLNGFPGLLSVIVPTEVSSTDAIVGKVVDVVDYVFLDVRQLRPPLLPTYAFCRPLALEIVKQIVNSPGYNGNEPKFCPVLSVAPWLVEALPGLSGSAVPMLTRLSPTSQLGGDPGMSSALRMCGPPMPCEVRQSAPNINDCLAVGGSTSLYHLLIHVFHSEARLGYQGKARLSWQGWALTLGLILTISVFRIVSATSHIGGLVGDVGWIGTKTAILFPRGLKTLLSSGSLCFRRQGSCKSSPYVFIGDEAFQQRPDFMRPLPGSRTEAKDVVFNYRLIRARFTLAGRNVERGLACGVVAKSAVAYKFASVRRDVTPETTGLDETAVRDKASASMMIFNALMTSSPSSDDPLSVT
ncbi:hypothetical protein HPB49_019422 [Dermacentor silvarum]|uniref:Uncharacterized protein n=1 Tax=Dermacentor silvarum TaxID=543639 RepID=A0ACB8C519_DERSI|nr:hypothetical protein HPB49_019422 [Dermacentor silvarum]